MKILVTCPPMLGLINEFRPFFEEKNVELLTPNVVQIMSEKELIELVPTVDGWIIGDDPATADVFRAGAKGKLKAAVKWGVGVNNVDFEACKNLNIPITNTPNMFGAEVAGVAVAYVLGLARQLFAIDRGVRNGNWPKPAGISLSGKTIGLIGFGDVGVQVAKTLHALDMKIQVYDPFAAKKIDNYQFLDFPVGLHDCDFLIFTCALTKSTYHMLNAETLVKAKDGVRIINMARGQIIDETALIDALKSKKVHSCAMEVFEVEPLPMNSELRSAEFQDRCIFGSHNASNTVDAVRRASAEAIQKIFKFLSIE